MTRVRPATPAEAVKALARKRRPSSKVGDEIKELLAVVRRSQEWFASTCKRSPRTGRRWVAGEAPVEDEAVAWLRRHAARMHEAEAQALRDDPPPDLPALERAARDAREARENAAQAATLRQALAQA